MIIGSINKEMKDYEEAFEETLCRAAVRERIVFTKFFSLLNFIQHVYHSLQEKKINLFSFFNTVYRLHLDFESYQC